MDVRCTKCGIEYEFDDAKVTAAGVTVKCTSCGHVFKVKPEEPTFSSPPTSGSFRADGEWMVRQPGGTIYRFKELTTLQKWIVERKVSRDDEISKTGKTWKRLGDVAELASFFQVVDAATAALQASVVAVQPAMTLPSMASPPMPPAPIAPAATPVTALVSGAALDAAAPAPAAPQVPVRPAPPRPADGASALDGMDDDDPVLEWQRSKRRRLMAATVLLVIAALAAVGWAFRDRLAELVGSGATATLAPATIDAALAALRADSAEARAAVRPTLDAAASAPAAPPEALAWQARLDIAAAAEQRELGRLHAALAALGGPDGAKHEAAARDANAAADATLAAAYRVVGELRARAPALPDGHLAGAAYQLEKGGFAEARGDLEAARKATAPAALPGIDAEIGVQQALVDARAALAAPDPAALAAAAERIPQSDDGRLRGVRASLRVQALARLAAAKAPMVAADLEAAHALVSALPAPDERTALLLALLELAKPPATPAAQLDAGPVPAADAGMVSPADVAAVGDAGPAAIGDGANDSYDVVMQKAERARVNGKSRQAYELFAKATKLKPSAPRPWLGVGWAAMDLGRNTESMRAFKKAVDLSPDIGEAHFGLAEAYRFNGDKAAAVAEYQEFLRLEPKSRDAEVAKRAIDSLKE